MIIKKADDKTGRLEFLENLKKLPSTNARQKELLEKELHRLRQGIRGEKDAAYYIDFHYADDRNFAVLHDLRITDDKWTAQIDHLILGRYHAFLLETKNFNGDVTIDENGHFSVKYSYGRTYGIDSPLEQSRRHEKIFLKLLDKLNIHAVGGGPLKVEHVILLSPKSKINKRRAPKDLDVSNIIKADELRAWHERFMNRPISVSKFLILGANALLRDRETVREWAEKISRQHRRNDFLELPDFMKT